ncbi:MULTISPECIES: MFS transporter [Streptomyces]|uniref:MFS transporter n=1 Tax=Streptomyces tsukubensis (strain DSM 42081 / NBRC 108919 / NRRL 18488 / 9993) TaxID=1114943 RepID=I2NA64_STRT9|nr:MULTISPECIES: MFS transporter [Streptomyces]AZK97696.1 MFS transporter [Streptomyces tsukubensis]EIF93911.1 putative major facilitator superfamily transporter [Streptomyces tsukubensis NRRL18488]MYS64345.1 MFS transporter [Streptomyces sp. SID5473]QKM66368.1 MFS transporter [Streptomyces tsukubensis NRRL18488]TAI45293.1 MFS transporter [Streptomyces tsukubensis]
MTPQTPADTRVIRVLLGSTVLSKVADWQLGIVIPLAVLAETDSVAMSLVSFAMRGVSYVASPVIGSLIDRFDRRRIFVLAQVQQAVCLVLLAVFISHPVSVSALVLVSGLGGVASSITGQFVLIPALVSAPARALAVAKLNSAIEFSKVIGLLAGGTAFSLLGPAATSLCIALLYLGAGSVAALLPPVPGNEEKTALRRDLTIGFRWVAKPEILWLVITMSMTNIAIGQLEPALITQFADRQINVTLISVLMAIGLLSGAVASRLAPRILPGWGPERRILAWQVVGLASLTLVATPWTPVQVAGFMIECFAVAGSNVASITYRQETIPVEVAGRANATIRMFITGAVPLSGFLFAWASHLGGYRFWLPSLAIWALAVVIWAVYTRHGNRLKEPEAAATG